MLEKIFRSIASVVSKVILVSCGWNIVKPSELEYIENTKKAVMIYPHSSYMDFFIFSLYYYAYGLKDIYTIMTEQFVIFPSLMPSIIACPNESVRYYLEMGNGKFMSIVYSLRDKIFKINKDHTINKKHSFINRLYDDFKDVENFKILISPSGSIGSNAWKSGYYNIAKKFDMPVLVCGIDYSLKNLASFEPHNINNCEKDEIIYKKKFDKISHFHNTENLDIINKCCIINTISFLYHFKKILNLAIENFIWYGVGYFLTNLFYSQPYKGPHNTNPYTFYYLFYKFMMTTNSVYYSILNNHYHYLCTVAMLLWASYQLIQNSLKYTYKERSTVYITLEIIYCYSLFLMLL